MKQIALLSVVAILGMISFSFPNDWKSGSWNSNRFLSTGNVQLKSIPWGKTIDKLPKKPHECPESYLTYEDNEASSSPSLTLISFTNALYAASVSDLTLFPPKSALTLLEHFDLTFLQSHFCIALGDIKKGSPTRVVRGKFGDDMLFHVPPAGMRGRILAAILLNPRDAIRRTVEHAIHTSLGGLGYTAVHLVNPLAECSFTMDKDIAMDPRGAGDHVACGRPAAFENYLGMIDLMIRETFSAGGGGGGGGGGPRVYFSHGLSDFHLGADVRTPVHDDLKPLLSAWNLSTPRDRRWVPARGGYNVTCLFYSPPMQLCPFNHSVPTDWLCGVAVAARIEALREACDGLVAKYRVRKVRDKCNALMHVAARVYSHCRIRDFLAVHSPPAAAADDDDAAAAKKAAKAPAPRRPRRGEWSDDDPDGSGDGGDGDGGDGAAAAGSAASPPPPSSAAAGAGGGWRTLSVDALAAARRDTSATVRRIAYGGLAGRANETIWLLSDLLLLSLGGQLVHSPSSALSGCAAALRGALGLAVTATRRGFPTAACHLWTEPPCRWAQDPVGHWSSEDDTAGGAGGGGGGGGGGEVPAAAAVAAETRAAVMKLTGEAHPGTRPGPDRDPGDVPPPPELLRLAKEVYDNSTYHPKWLVTIIVSSAFVDMTRNFICNLKRLGLHQVLSSTLFLALDKASFNSVEGHHRILWTPVPATAEMSYGSAGYYLLMHRRTELILTLLKMGISVAIVETDATWFVDVVAVVNQERFRSADAISYDDTGKGEPCGGLLFLRPTPNTTALWSALTESHHHALACVENGGHPGPSQFTNPDWGSEQIMMSNMWRTMPGSFVLLPSKNFRSGKWYFNATRDGGIAYIHSNYIIGQAKKVARLKRHGQWYLNGTGHCAAACGADARLHVLTMARPAALARLAASLAAADYAGMWVDLAFWVDVPAAGPGRPGPGPGPGPDPETVRFAQGFKWHHGVKSVNVWPRHAGIYGNWIESWQPERELTNCKTFVVMLEDDVEVSPHFLKWFRAAVRAYGKHPAVASFAGQRASLRARGGGDFGSHVPPGINAFAYRLMGSWGLGCTRQRWLEFRNWYHKVRAIPGFEPEVKGILPNDWYKSFKRQGKEGSMWTMWFIRFMDEMGYYTIYPWINGGSESLVSNWREPGMHYDAKRDAGTVGRPDAPVMEEWADDVGVFTNEGIPALGWDGAVEGTLRPAAAGA